MLTSVQQLVSLPFGFLAYERTLLFHINQCVYVYTFERSILLLRSRLLVDRVCLTNPVYLQFSTGSAVWQTFSAEAIFDGHSRQKDTNSPHPEISFASTLAIFILLLFLIHFCFSKFSCKCKYCYSLFHVLILHIQSVVISRPKSLHG